MIRLLSLFRRRHECPICWYLADYNGWIPRMVIVPWRSR